MTGAPRSRCVIAAEWSAFIAAAVALAALGARLASGVDGPFAPVALAAGSLAGLAACDLVSGLVHWAGDHLDEATPLVGPLLVTGFLEHHRDPDAITRHGFAEVNGGNAFVVLPILAAVAAAGAPGSVAAVCVQAFFLAGGAAGLVTNQIHQWAHMARAPRPVRWLQRSGLVLSPQRHAAHHRGDHRRAYCITAGRMDFLLERTGVLRALEAALGAPRPERS